MADQKDLLTIQAKNAEKTGESAATATQPSSVHVVLPSDKEIGKTEASVGTPQSPSFADVPSFSWSGYIQGLGLMFLLLAGLWFFVRLLKRYGRFNFIPRQGTLAKDSFFMEAQMPLGPRKCLMVVRFMNRRYLLGVTEQTISVLTSHGLSESDDEMETHSFEECVQNAKRTQ